MSIQITVNPQDMTQAQREAFAGFILTYPVASELDKEVEILAKEGAQADKKFDNEVVAQLTQLNTPLEPLSPQLAAQFGGVHAASAIPSHELEASAVFGNTPPPLPVGAQPAPFIAAAIPLPTAPVVPTAITSTAPLSVPLPPAVPPVPQLSPAPTVPAAPANPANGVEVDKNGLPWDGRIHASTKRKNADQTWTSRRGVDPALVATVEAELRQVMGVAPSAPLPPVAASPVAPVPSVPVAVLPAASVAPNERAQFVSLVGRAAAAIQAGKVSQADVTQCCAALGIPALPLLANRLDLVAQVAAAIDELIASRS